MKGVGKRLFVPLAGLALGLATPDRLPAGSISYDVAIDIQWPGVSAGDLPQFNPALGVLDSISFSGTIHGLSPYAFNSPQTNVAYGSEVIVFLAALPNPTIYFASSDDSASFDSPVLSADLVSSFNVSGTVAVDPSFYGTGDLFLVASAGAEVDLSEASLVLFGESGGDITFTYTYGVPEPPAYILAAIAAILPVALIARRRRAARSVRAEFSHPA